MKQKRLAQLLEISEAMVSRLVRRGMPTSSVEEARRWRAGNLASLRIDLRPAADSVAARVEAVRRLMLLAADDFDAHADQLRAAMRAVPQHARPDLLLNLDVMKRLLPVGLINDLGSECDAPGDPEDLEYSAQVLYGLAAGELLWT